MTGTQFVPLTADLIDEGEFLADLDDELQALQQVLTTYAKSHGDKALKAKAKLSIDIELSIQSVDDGAYAVKTTMKSMHPKRPASISLAIAGATDTGQMALFVRKSGSDVDDPRQQKLSTRDGRTIADGEADGEFGDGKSAAAGD